MNSCIGSKTTTLSFTLRLEACIRLPSVGLKRDFPLCFASRRCPDERVCLIATPDDIRAPSFPSSLAHIARKLANSGDGAIYTRWLVRARDLRAFAVHDLSALRRAAKAVAISS